MADNTTQNNTQNRMPGDADKSAEMNMQESPQNSAGDSVPETNANGQANRSYIAFISYRHKPLDIEIARKLLND